MCSAWQAMETGLGHCTKRPMTQSYMQQMRITHKKGVVKSKRKGSRSRGSESSSAYCVPHNIHADTIPTSMIVTLYWYMYVGWA